MPTQAVPTLKEIQQARLLEAQINCTETQRLQPYEISDDFCPITWDTALCWPSTRPGTTAQQQCPYYVYGFNPKGWATKFCTLNGSWFFSETTKTHWTNYTDCQVTPDPHSDNEFGNKLIEATQGVSAEELFSGNFDPLSDLFNKKSVNAMPETSNAFEKRLQITIITPHIENFKSIAQIGYSASFGTLLIAFFILTFVKVNYRRLRCPRNNLHLQLFASFMIRSFMFLIKDMFVYTTSSPDVPSVTDTHLKIKITSSEEQINALLANVIPTLSCKIFITIWQYSLVANYNWILMEGVYLHNLIFLHIFNDNSSIVKYIIVGWGVPILFVVPWVVIRALYEDKLCWTDFVTNSYWLLRGPITATIILNFVLFLNITRVLFLKMFSTSVLNYARQYRYKKWFKSTLILVPLFGVHYMFFLLFLLTLRLGDWFEIIWLYADLLFTSFQGCIVALLYCFCNGEVQQEVRKLWQAWRSNHSGTSWHSSHQSNHSSHSTTHQSYLTQSLTYLSRGRHSFLSTDNNVANKKDELDARSRSPSISRLQFPDTNTLVLECDDKKLAIDQSCPLTSGADNGVKQNASHNAKRMLESNDSSNESIM